jgi:NAD(P)H-nitrite reductase large subunit
MTRRHLIIGNGPAGVVAAETLRREAPGDDIILLGDELEPPYSRMAIPYLLVGNISEPGTYLRKSADHWTKLKVTLRQGRVSKLDVAAKMATLADGSTIAFDTCLVATGSQPVRPPIPGIDSPGVHPCWTLENARAIQKLMKPGARVLQMGAGFIGCIILEALANSGVKLTVVEMGDRMVPRMMGQTAGGMIKRWVQSKGVEVHTSTRVESISPVAGGLSVKLSDGTSLEVDLVISATGVKPNTAFLAGTGIEVRQGIVTNDQMQTNVAGVYAAGDCAEAFDAVTGATVVSAIQPNAADQARVAAMNMVGKPVHLRTVTQINVLDTLGLISTSFGQWQGVAGGEHVEVTDEARFKHLSLQFSGDVLVGANSLGMTDHVGVLRGLVEGKVKLGHWKETLMADPHKVMEAYLATSQAQTQWGVAHSG